MEYIIAYYERFNSQKVVLVMFVPTELLWYIHTALEQYWDWSETGTVYCAGPIPVQCEYAIIKFPLY